MNTPSKSVVFSKLMAKTTALGRMVTPKEVDQDPELPSTSTVEKLLGDWQHIASTLGYATHVNARRSQRSKRNPFTKQELLDQMYLKAAELGGPPTLKQMATDPRFASGAVFSRAFDNWNNALRIAGFKVHYRGNATFYSRKELIAQLQSKAINLGRLPVESDMDNDLTVAHSNAFKREFGSWPNALQAAAIVKR